MTEQELVEIEIAKAHELDVIISEAEVKFFEWLRAQHELLQSLELEKIE